MEFSTGRLEWILWFVLQGSMSYSTDTHINFLFNNSTQQPNAFVNF